MLTNPSVVMFAIQAGVRLSGQFRSAYVDNIKRSELILPLPNFPNKPDSTSALNYFEDEGADHVENDPEVADLVNRAQRRSLSKEDQEAFLQIYQRIRSMESADSGEFIESGISAENLQVLFSIRQWQEGNDPNSTALQRIAGSVVETAVDFYTQGPGVINENAAHGKALKGFLAAIDDVSFSNTPVEEFAPELLVAAIETIDMSPHLLSGDGKAGELITTVTHGLASDIKIRLEKIRAGGAGDLQAEERVRQWGQLIFRSVLKNAGETVLPNPEKFLNIKSEGDRALVSNVGGAFLDVILAEDGVQLDAVFSGEGVDKVVKTAFKTLNEHPELLGVDNKGLKNILQGVAGELAESTTALGPDILPDVMQMVLDKTTGNLEILWPGDFEDPAQHLLITASKEVLSILSQSDAADDKWRPRFTHAQLLEVTNNVLDEVVQNPDWLIKEAGNTNPILHEAMEGALAALQKIPGNRLTSEAGLNILQSTIKTVALRKEFINKVPFGDTGENTRLITIALDAVGDLIVGDNASAEARWILARNDVFDKVAEKFLNRLAEEGITPEKIIALKDILEGEIHKFTQGENFTPEALFHRLKTAALTA